MDTRRSMKEIVWKKRREEGVKEEREGKEWEGKSKEENKKVRKE